MKNTRTTLAEGLSADFAEWIEGDEDVLELLQDKLMTFMEQKAAYLSEDGRYDLGMEVLSNLAIR